MSSSLAQVSFSKLALRIYSYYLADGGDMNALQDFNLSWIAEFRRTNAFEVWDRITDPMLFDIVEARQVL